MEKDKAKCESYLAEKSKFERDFHDKQAKIVDLLQELSESGRDVQAITWRSDVTTAEDAVIWLNNRLERNKIEGSKTKWNILNECYALWRDKYGNAAAAEDHLPKKTSPKKKGSSSSVFGMLRSSKRSAKSATDV